MTLPVRADVPLGPHTTLGLGGPARHYLEAPDAEVVAAGVAWAARRRLPVFLLGGGSNVVVGDGGFPGLVIRMTSTGVEWDGAALPRSPRLRPERTPRAGGDTRLVTAHAGQDWDEFVAGTVSRGLAGLECLSGIPGTVGAAPVQNVGAYGQEAADTIVSVTVLDLASLETLRLDPPACGFAYRDSIFRRHPGRYGVLDVTFALRPGGAPTVTYGELVAALPDRPAPGLAQVREAVLAMRRRKSMLLDPADENARSVGSFFTNPVLGLAEAERVLARAGAEAADAPPPRFPTGDGRVKLSAAWLIEHAGFGRGFRRGRVGISTRHSLALVNLGGATTGELLALAGDVRGAVRERFGVDLEMEPVCVGCSPPWRPSPL